MNKRPGFAEIVEGWTTVSGFADITDRIERAAEWTRLNGPLLPDEEVTISAMIRTQIARAEEEGIGIADPEETYRDCVAAHGFGYLPDEQTSAKEPPR